MPKKSAPNREAGFTFVEVMVAVGVVGIMSAIALPSLQRTIRTNEIRGEVRTVYNDLQRVRQQTLTKGALGAPPPLPLPPAPAPPPGGGSGSGSGGGGGSGQQPPATNLLQAGVGGEIPWWGWALIAAGEAGLLAFVGLMMSGGEDDRSRDRRGRYGRDRYGRDFDDWDMYD